jgi:hypothetical protein
MACCSILNVNADGLLFRLLLAHLLHIDSLIHSQQKLLLAPHCASADGSTSLHASAQACA